MRLYYIDESEGPSFYVHTALGVDAERWNDLFHGVQEGRHELQDRYAVPADRELHACHHISVSGQALLAWNRTYETVCSHQALGCKTPIQFYHHWLNTNTPGR